MSLSFDDVETFQAKTAQSISFRYCMWQHQSLKKILVRQQHLRVYQGSEWEDHH